MNVDKEEQELIATIVLKAETTTKRIEQILSDAGCVLGAHFKNLCACSALIPAHLIPDVVLDSIRKNDEVVSAELTKDYELIAPPEFEK